MKRGKKYIEAAKLIERGNLYEKEEAVALVKKAATAKFDETIEAHIRTGCDDVMQISRSAARLFFRTEQVKKFAFLYLQKTQRQKKQKQQELIL